MDDEVVAAFSRGVDAAGVSSVGSDCGLPAVNLGVNGFGAIGNGRSDFDGGQAITGEFNGGNFENYLVYYPSGSNTGLGVILGGTADGAPIKPSHNESSFSPARSRTSTATTQSSSPTPTTATAPTWPTRTCFATIAARVA